MIKIVADNKIQIEELMKRLEKLESEWSSLSERTDRLEDRIKDLMSRGNRIKTIRSGMIGEAREIPKKIMDEISSLKEIVADLSTENEQFRRLARDIRVTQMEAISPDVFINVLSRLSSLEKKVVEIEEDLSKIVKSNPVVLE